MYVLDSSAVIAVFRREPGWTAVSNVLTQSLISSVNLGEVYRVLTRKGAPISAVRESLTELDLSVSDFGEADAAAAAEVNLIAPHLGIGDCACLALAISLKAKSVLTTDSIWTKVPLGVKIQLIR